MDIESLQEDREQDQMADLVTGGEAAADGGAEGGDWRVRMQQESRERNVNKIMEALKSHSISFSEEDGLEKLKEEATRIEEEFYVSASSQSDYLRKISFKILTLEAKFQNPMANCLQSNAASSSKNPQVLGSQSLESQIQNMVQKHQSQVKQHLLSQNIQNNIPLTGVPNFFGSSSALPSFGGNSQATVPSVPFQQTPMVQSLFNATPNAAGNLIGKGWPTSDMSQVAQRQGMQQQSLARIHSQQLLQLANASVRDTRQGIQSTDTAPQQQTTIDQQKRLMQNLQSQRDVRLQPFPFQSMLTLMPENLSQNIPSTGVPNSSGVTTALPSAGGKSLGTVRNVSVQNPNMQNTYNATPCALGNLMGQASLDSLDSSSQIGSVTDEDWQEETYQKIKAMHDMYYRELNELYQQVVDQVQQHDALPQQPKNEQLEKLRSRKLAIERLIKFLQTNKNDIDPSHEGKIAGVGKRIKFILKGNRCSSRPGQSTQPPPMHATQQPQVSQTHMNEGQMNSQMQPVNIHSSALPTQQNNLTGLQQNTITSGSNISGSPQNNVAMKLNPLGGPQLMTASSGTSTNGLANANMLQPISSILHPQYQQWHNQQLRLQQQMQQQQLIQQQQFIQQLMLQLQQQQTFQPMQSQQSLLQPMQPQLKPLLPPLPQPGLLQQKQQLLQLQQALQQQPKQLSGKQLVEQHLQQQTLQRQQQQVEQQLKQQLLQQTSQKQPEHVPEKQFDVEKQQLIPKQKTAQKQRSGQKTMPRLKTASLILVISALLLLALVMMLFGVVMGINQLYWG